MSVFYRIAAVALLLSPSAWVWSQESDEWTAYTSMRGIKKLLVHQDVVWAVSSGGVLRFDQQTRRYDRFTRLDGLAGNQVSSLAVDFRGDLWFGTDHQGLSRLRSASGGIDPPFLDFEELDINVLAAVGNSLFVGTDRGISVFLIDKEEVKENYRQLGRMAKDIEVFDLLVFEDKLWAGTSRGIAWADLELPNLQDPDSWRSNTLPGRVEDLFVFNDTLYCASRRSVWRLDTEAGRPRADFSNPDIVALGDFKGRLIGVTSSGTFYQRRAQNDWEPQRFPGIRDVRAISGVDTALWIGTEDGLKVVGAPPPPPSREPMANYFFDMELTDDGHLWVATVPKDNLPPFGLYQFDGEGWTVHDLRTGLSSESVTNVEADAGGHLWVGNWGRGIDVLDSTGTWRRINHTNSVLDGIGASKAFVAISDIARDADGLMWVTNLQIGLAVMDGYPPTQSLMYHNQAIGLASGRDIGKLAIAADGLKWISTPRDGFLLFDDGGTPFTEGDEYAQVFNTLFESRLSSDRTSDILIDRSGQLWVGTDNGLNAVRGAYSRATHTFRIDDWRVYNTSSGLPSNEIKALEEGSRGNVWVGTEAGLVQISADGKVNFSLTTANSGLIDNRINSLLFDPDSGDLWIATLDGLSRLRVEQGRDSETVGPMVYPNPFPLGLRGSGLTFSGLPLGASLDIFTLDGRLVNHLEGTPGQGTLLWNGQNAAGFLAGSGIYLFVAMDETGNIVRGKFAVINSR